MYCHIRIQHAPQVSEVTLRVSNARDCGFNFVVKGTENVMIRQITQFHQFSNVELSRKVLPPKSTDSQLLSNKFPHWAEIYSH